MADTAENPKTRVVLIVAKRGGLVLFGKRRDNGRWTLPGGHVEESETDFEAALRELSEETGLSPIGALEPIDERDLGSMHITTFECEVEGVPSGKKDPDKECELYAFFDMEDGVPKAVAQNMAGPKDPEKNVTADLFGLAKMAIADIPLGQQTDAPSTPDHGTGEIKWYDYSHVLTPEHWTAGYTMKLRHQPQHSHYLGNINAYLYHNGKNIGLVGGSVYPNGIQVDSDIDDGHQGKGLGRAMYEAVYAHAFHNGVKKVVGFDPSSEAQRVHESLARRHGLDYQLNWPSFDEKDPENSGSEYSYDLKSELTKALPPEDDVDRARLMMATDKVKRAQMTQGWGEPGADGRHGALTLQQGQQQLDAERQASPVQEPTSPVRRIRNRFVGTKTTEATSGLLGTTRRPMSERVAFDYSHQLTPAQREAGLALTLYHHPQWDIHNPDPKSPHPLLELTRDGRQIAVRGDPAKTLTTFKVPDAELPGDPELDARGLKYNRKAALVRAMGDAAHEHVQNTKRTVVDGTARFGQRQIPFLDSLKAPDQFESRVQGLEIDKRRRARKDAAPAPSGVGRHIEVGEGAAPLPVPPHREMGNDERHLLWDYSHMLSPEDRAAGRRMEIRHTPGRFDDYMHGSFIDHADPTASMVGWAYPTSDSTVRLGGPVTPQTEARIDAMKRAIYHHQQLLRRGQLEHAVNSAAEPSRFSQLELSEHSMAKAYREPGKALVHPVEQAKQTALAYSQAATAASDKANQHRVVDGTTNRATFNEDAANQHVAAVNSHNQAARAFKALLDLGPHKPENTKSWTRAMKLHEQFADYHRGLVGRANEPYYDLNSVQAVADFFTKPRHFGPIVKAEESDEVDRLLLHPDPAERTMALKLHGVKGRHLARAFQDDDAGVQHAALRHPALDGHALLNLMQMPARAHLQLLALQHPRVEPRHVEALYHTAKGEPLADRARLLHAVSHHDLVDEPLIERMHAEGNGRALVENLRTPPRVLDRIVEDHLADPRDDEKRALARRALKHPKVSTNLVERAWKEGPGDVKIAVAQSQHLPEALAQDALARGQRPDGDGEALLRSFIINNPKASQRHLETASRDRNPLVRHAARSRLGQVAKFEAGFNDFLGEQLAKATRSKDFAGVLRASDPKGSDVVDHAAEATEHPPANNPDVAAYRQAVLESPEIVKRSGTSSREGVSDGVTRKLLYSLPADHPTHGGVKFMVKPYHERILRRNKKRMSYPYQGWAEMTNQALYHAGGIGHLHQNVHVSQHDMGPGHEKEPALVVRMDPGWKTISDVPWDGEDWPEYARTQGRQIGIMDFLTQNLDRHTDNLLYHPQRGLLAIDHPRSFQYKTGNGPKWSAGPDEANDRFGWYVNSASALDGLASVPNPYGAGRYPHGLEGNLQAIKDWQPAFDWWGDNGNAIRSAFNKRLALIKDPDARAHLARNFHSRADWLDQRADMGLANHGQDWYNDTARVYRPGELTDDEREAAFHPEEQ